MREMFTIMEARKMTKKELEARLTACREELESSGMEHTDACKFLSEVMNIGIAIQEKEKQKKYSGRYPWGQVKD